jgi:hypothetical protein
VLLLRRCGGQRGVGALLLEDELELLFELCFCFCDES